MPLDIIKILISLENKGISHGKNALPKYKGLCRFLPSLWLNGKTTRSLTNGLSRAPTPTGDCANNTLTHLTKRLLKPRLALWESSRDSGWEGRFAWVTSRKKAPVGTNNTLTHRTSEHTPFNPPPRIFDKKSQEKTETQISSSKIQNVKEVIREKSIQYY